MKNIKIAILSLSIMLFACSSDEDNNPGNIDFKEEMRSFIIGISTYSKAINSDFFIIPQNGIELVTTNGEDDGIPHAEYLNAIDGNGQEDLFYGYNNDDQATPSNENEYLRTLLDKSKSEGNTILVTDYCSTPSKMNDSYLQNNLNNYVSFAADHRELDNIPNYPNTIYSNNNNTVSGLSTIQNFLYLINPDNYNSKTEFINAVIATNYDLLIMDLYYEGTTFSSDEINQLRAKANGANRLVICYMSIGEAEDYRYYWENEWNNNRPDWLDTENPDWAGNFKVKYWDPDWQNIIYGHDNSYLKMILDANFDGVYLDIIDAFEFYE